MPRYVRDTRVKQGARMLKVKAGTQYIDGVWRVLKHYCHGVHGTKATIDTAIRYAQWRYWTQGRDMIKEIALTL